MKRILQILAITCVLGLVLGFSACNDKPEKAYKTVTVSVVAEGFDKTFALDGQVATVEDVLDALATVNDEFSFKCDNGPYGSYIKEMCGRAQDESSGLYWSYYTDSLREIYGVPNAYAEYTYAYGEKTFYSCASGITEQAAADGEHFVFVLAGY